MLTIPETMRAVVLIGHGGLDKLQYREDWPTPAPRPGEVLIKVGACGLNNTDINTRTAWYSRGVADGITESGGKSGFDNADSDSGNWFNTTLSFPRIQGADVAGRIAAVGEGVDPGRIGERVLINPWLHGHGDWHLPQNTGYFGSECDGGFADYTRVRAENAITVHSELSDAELACFPTALTTAEHLVWRTGLQPGEWVVVTGASGGVGTTAIQLCLARGARVIGVASAFKAQALLDLGCTAVIERNAEDLERRIMEAADGPVDVVLDVVGGTMFMPILNTLRQRGRLSTSGAIAGPVVEFDLRQLIYKDIQMTGATICPPHIFSRTVQLVSTGAVKPMLAYSYPLRDLKRAQEAFLAKKYTGNIVVTMD